MTDKVKKFKSKVFRVAVEGGTTDGREITRDWIEQMVANYNPKDTYGARINLEHYLSAHPDSTFCAYGDVLSLSAKEDDGKLGLYAQIDPTQECIELNKRRQKVYTSIEVDPNFAKSGEAYLVGLALTDSPASLGTEMLEFSAQAKINPLSSRKKDPGNVFSAAIETNIEFVEVPEQKKMIDAVKAMFNKQDKKTAAHSDNLEQVLIDALEEFNTGCHREFCSKTELTEAIANHKGLQESFNKLQTAHDALVEKLSREEDPGQHMPPATGGNDKALTDC